MDIRSQTAISRKKLLRLLHTLIRVSKFLTLVKSFAFLVALTTGTPLVHSFFQKALSLPHQSKGRLLRSISTFLTVFFSVQCLYPASDTSSLLTLCLLVLTKSQLSALSAYLKYQIKISNKSLKTIKFLLKQALVAITIQLWLPKTKVFFKKHYTSIVKFIPIQQSFESILNISLSGIIGILAFLLPNFGLRTAISYVQNRITMNFTPTLRRALNSVFMAMVVVNMISYIKEKSISKHDCKDFGVNKWTYMVLQYLDDGIGYKFLNNFYKKNNKMIEKPRHVLSQSNSSSLEEQKVQNLEELKVKVYENDYELRIN